MICASCLQRTSNPFRVFGKVKPGCFCSADCMEYYQTGADRAASFAAEGLELIPGENPDRHARFVENMFWDRIEAAEAQTWLAAYNTIQELNAVYSQVLQYKRPPTILKKRFEAAKLAHFNACRRAHVSSKWVGGDEFDRLFLREQPINDGGALASYKPKTTDEVPF